MPYQVGSHVKGQCSPNFFSLIGAECGELRWCGVKSPWKRDEFLSYWPPINFTKIYLLVAIKTYIYIYNTYYLMIRRSQTQHPSARVSSAPCKASLTSLTRPDICVYDHHSQLAAGM
jgi:hypothetical protein